MSRLVAHLLAICPPQERLGAAIRYLKEPRSEGGDYRSMGGFRWHRPPWFEASLRDMDDLVSAEGEHWAWVHDVCGGPERAARHRYLHGVWIAGAVMLRTVSCPLRPANGGGTFEEVGHVLALAIDMDIAERRPGDRRRYCPSIAVALDFLSAFAPSLVLDGGGGLVAVWLLDEPCADRIAARRLSDDLHAALVRAGSGRRWLIDSPPPFSAWVKVPGLRDHFRQHVVGELVTDGPPWSFLELRSAVPGSRRRPRRNHYREEAE